MQEQELDWENLSCPECNADINEETKVKHNLGNVGYQHDDISFECVNGHNWVHGHPIGDPPREMWEYLECQVCDEELMLPHRIHVKPNGGIDLDLKCPNCFHFKTVERKLGDRNRVMYGYPQITGSFEDATPFGYRSQKVLNTVNEE